MFETLDPKVPGITFGNWYSCKNKKCATLWYAIGYSQENTLGYRGGIGPKIV
jgi:hypothetical protein